MTPHHHHDDDGDAVVRRLMHLIDTEGWAVIGTSKGGLVPIAYTLGLTFLRVPELYVEGLDIETATLVLNDLAARQRKAGSFDPGQLTQAGGRMVRLIERPDLANMPYVRMFFGDGKPIPPRALAVQLA
jgi:hypothetical protein